MIELTISPTGRKVFLAPSAIAKISEAGPSSQYHGIRSFVKTFDGETVEASEDIVEIDRQMKAHDK